MPDHVWAVIVYDSTDGVYLFADEEQAARFAQPYGEDAHTSEQPVMSGEQAEEAIRAAQSTA